MSTRRGAQHIYSSIRAYQGIAAGGHATKSSTHAKWLFSLGMLTFGSTVVIAMANKSANPPMNQFIAHTEGAKGSAKGDGKATSAATASIGQYIDHTVLKQTCLDSDIIKVCNEAKTYNFVAVCVPPNFVKLAKEQTAGSNVKVATVIGFPFGYSCTAAKKAEATQALKDGADELDIVANISAIKNKQWDVIKAEIKELMPCRNCYPHQKVKVIIESGMLTDEEIIKCCEIYGNAGIDFLKTSTGYAEGGKGATVAHVQLFRANLPANVQIKASGGIRDYAAARAMIDAGATRIGCSAGVSIVQGQAASGPGAY
jgi:deoxyribose-phosphate aldolase